MSDALPAEVFETELPVRFEHVDVWGIVFYPRYFELLSAVVEDWFQKALGISYRQFHEADSLGIPLVDIHCQFFNPSFLSDSLRFELRVTRMGRRSMSMNITCFCGDEKRMQADMTVVYARRQDGVGRSLDIPPELRAKIRPFVIEGGEA